jgi:hypothetical protein
VTQLCYFLKILLARSEEENTIFILPMSSDEAVLLFRVDEGQNQLSTMARSSQLMPPFPSKRYCHPCLPKLPVTALERYYPCTHSFVSPQLGILVGCAGQALLCARLFKSFVQGLFPLALELGAEFTGRGFSVSTGL